MLQSKSFANKSNVIKGSKRFQQTKYNQVQIINAYSINLESHYFTNFTSRNNDINERFIEIYDNVVNKNKDFELYCEGTELNGYGLNTNRLIDIINSYPNMNVTNKNITEIVKYKNKQKYGRGLQFYVRNNKLNNILEIVLIDFHHLGLPSEMQKTKYSGLIRSNPKRQYKKLKKCDYDIVDLITDYKDSKT